VDAVEAVDAVEGVDAVEAVDAVEGVVGGTTVVEQGASGWSVQLYTER